MFISDPRNIKYEKYDLVVVGSGPAGTSILDSFKYSSKRILILEAGFSSFEEISQEIYKGTTSGYPHADLELWRKRQLGGSSNCWGGACVPYDEIDFLLKNGETKYWPIELNELVPFYLEAGEFYGIGNYYSIKNYPILFKNDIKNITQSYLLVNDQERKFRSKIERIVDVSKNIDLCLKANVIDINFYPNSNKINSVILEDYEGFRKKIFSDKFVICCGGIESTRILLNWSEKYKQFNQIKKNLGYYYSPHINLNCGTLITAPNQIVNAKYININKNITSLPFFSYKFNDLEQNKFLNSKWTIANAFHKFNKKQFLKYLITGDRSLKQTQKKPTKKENTINQLILDYLSQGNKKGDIYYLDVAFDQTPTRESCLKLIDEKDRFKLKKVNLNYHISNIDIEKIKNTSFEIAKLIALNNIGRVKIEDIEPIINENEIGRSHHTGTIRMASNSSFGCVDKNLKVFGVQNLWVCSSSVFPTPSHANPTFTIMAMAKRLSNHIKNEN